MSNYPKYRLKKDTPNFEAGNIFVIHSDEGSIFPQASDFIYDPRGNYYDSVGNIKHFDEWFEEVKEQPKWVRKQIKQVVYHNAKTDTLNWKYVDVKYRFIKGHFYYDSRTSFSINNKLDESEIRFFENANGDELRRKLGYFNQLIRDGYIEIQDNPNIVWEDEKCD